MPTVLQYGGGGGNLVPGDLQVWSAEKYSHSLGVFFGARSATARLVFFGFSLCFFALFRQRCLSCLTFSSVALAGQ